MLVQASTLITEFHRLQEDLESIFLKLGYNKQLEDFRFWILKIPPTAT
jgi:hypothetical protein